MFVESCREATRQGLEAFAYDVEFTARPRGFSLSEITVPASLWHGELDNSTPVGMVKAPAARIPDSTLHSIPGHGHILF